MRIMLLILSVMGFLSSQGLAHSCLDSCSHHQKKNISEPSEHDCCDESKSSRNEENAHNCKFGDCFKSTDFELSTFPAEAQSKKKSFDPSISRVDSTDLNANLSKNSLEVDFQDIWRDSPKVPLYIAYQKLLLP